MPDSTRPIRALLRGLDALKVLNVRSGATVSEVAGDIRLPRTTTYRVLETLAAAGYIYRDPADDRYRLSIMVRALSDGFDDEAWVGQIARPILAELSRETVWPVAIATLSGTSMMVRETTDHRSPIAVERQTAGTRLPMLTSAAGRAYLAYSAPAQQDALIEILSRSAREEDKLGRNPAELKRIINETRTQGYASAVQARRIADEISLAVPVMDHDRVLAALSLRFSATAVPMKLALERFLPRLSDAADQIARRLDQERGGRPQPAASDSH